MSRKCNPNKVDSIKTAKCRFFAVCNDLFPSPPVLISGKSLSEKFMQSKSEPLSLI